MIELYRSDMSQAVLEGFSHEHVSSVMERIEPRENGRTQEIADELGQTVFFQDEATESVARTLVRAESAFNDPDRPLASLMFLGASGVGKTEMAHAISQHLFNDPDSDRLKILNMGEFQESHSVSKIVGSPPSYVGYAEESVIPHDWLNKEQKSVIVFDEIEKAHPDVHRMLLGILDKGTLSARNGVKGFQDLHFNNSLLIFTSNLGATEIQDATEGKSMGFSRPTDTDTQAVDVKAIAERELSKKYAPEFIKRFDDVVVFNTLRREEGHFDPLYYKFFNEKNSDLAERFKGHAPFLWSTDEAKEWILDQAGNKGGREVRRIIEREIFTKAAELFGDMDLTGRPMVAGVEDGKVVFFTDKLQEMADKTDEEKLADVRKEIALLIPDTTRDDMRNNPLRDYLGDDTA